MYFCPKCNNTYVVSQNITTKTRTDESPSETNQDITKIPKVIFKCSNCMNIEYIKPGTLIASRTNEKANSDYVDETQYKDMIYDCTLPCTRNYICPNDKCASHKDFSKREAIWFRPSKYNYNIKYVCKECRSYW